MKWPGELTPFVAGGSQPHQLGLARGGRDSRGHFAPGKRLAALLHHVGVQVERLIQLGLIRHVIQPHRLALGHVSLIGHPAHHLAPEAIVVLVFHALAPAPGPVCAHEKHLARAERAGDQKRKPAELVADILVNAQNVGAGLGAKHRRVPLEARKSLPHLGIIVLCVGQLGQQAAPAQLGQLEVIGDPRAPAAGLGGIEHDRAQVAQLGVERATALAPASPA